MEPCEEMKKLREELSKRNIVWFDESDEMICRTHFKIGKNKWSVINGLATYGGIYAPSKGNYGNRGLLEITKLNRKTDEPIGYLTAQEAIDIIFNRV